MAMASEYLEVVLDDLYCCTYFRGVIEPENELPCTKLLIEIEATIRRVPSRDVHEEEIIEDNIRYSVNQDRTPV